MRKNDRWLKRDRKRVCRECKYGYDIIKQITRKDAQYSTTIFADNLVYSY